MVKSTDVSIVDVHLVGLLFVVFSILGNGHVTPNRISYWEYSPNTGAINERTSVFGPWQFPVTPVGRMSHSKDDKGILCFDLK